MDLRRYINSESDIAEAKALVASRSFTYQPFRITDQLEVGAGYTFVTRNPAAGLVYWPNYEEEKSSYLRPDSGSLRFDPRDRNEFVTANDAIRQVYDGFLDQVCEHVRDLSGTSLADIGCFNGYIPVSMSRRGARLSVGYDMDDRSGCFKFLNRILHTDARFVQGAYDLFSGTISACPAYDIVVSMSVLQHMAEPLRHLHFLRSITREALFLVTNVWDDDDYCMRLGAPRHVFDYAFPWCFDNSVYLSEKLLRRSLEEAGFVRVIDLETRFPKNVSHAEARGSHDYAMEDAKQPQHSMKGASRFSPLSTAGHGCGGRLASWLPALAEDMSDSRRAHSREATSCRSQDAHHRA